MKTSLILFAHNHHEFVRPALADFLSQSGEGFEFIILDDCSSDGTFEIIEGEISKKKLKYPKVKLWKTPHNLGYNDSINYALSKIDSDIIIPFAADDRFFSHRAIHIRTAMSKPDTWLAHSDCLFIDRFGNEAESLRKGILFYGDYSVRDAALSHALFIGATAGWSRKLFTKYGPIANNLAYEDLILGFRAALENGVVYVDQKLMSYRTGVGISFESREKSGLKDEYRRARLKYYQRKIDTLVGRISDIKNSGYSEYKYLCSELEKELKSNFYLRGIIQKWKIYVKREILNDSNTFRAALKEFRNIRKFREIH